MLRQRVSRGQKYGCRSGFGTTLKVAGEPASEPVGQARLNVGERDIGGAFREMNGKTAARLERSRRTHRASALPVEECRVTALECALRTQHFESRSQRGDACRLPFVQPLLRAFETLTKRIQRRTMPGEIRTPALPAHLQQRELRPRITRRSRTR